MKWITANDLTNWSEGAAARTDLPELVGDLIRASADSIATFRFPSGDAGNVRGFDGHLECERVLFYVPEGTSYWEMKTSKDAWSEGLKDFRKRSAQLSPDERAAATFMFVSSRVWDSSRPDRKIEDWVATCKAETPDWKDVRCLDACALETWLDECPAVAARFAKVKIGLVPQRGARSTDEFWDEFRHLFQPALVEDVLLAGRERSASKLLDALMRRDGSTSFVSDSPDEVTAFGVAVIRTAKPEIRAYLESRTIIVDDMAAGRELLARGSLNYFVRESAAERPGLFAEKGPTLVPLGREQRGNPGDLLNRPTAEAMGAALEKMGYDRREAIQRAHDAGRSIVALRRQIPGGHTPPPKWLNAAATILPAILAGAWDQNNDMDRDALRALSRAADYPAFERQIRPFRTMEDPPLDRIGSVWVVRAPKDAFLTAGAHIGDEVLDVLRAVLSQVFGHAVPRRDPKAVIRLNPEKADDYSDWLRDGLSTTLLQIAVWDKLADMPITISGQAFANRVVAEVPGLTTDPRVLASLKDQLPHLAEAAPDPLLSALEQMLGGSDSVLRHLFEEVDGFIHPVSEHTGLLWALETVAWDPDYFDRAVMVLAGLAAIDPGGRLGNRPINSLGEIFLPWHPSTKASVAQRTAALDRICKALPDVGWALLVMLLPTVHGVARDTTRPKLREAGSGETTVTYADYGEFQTAAVERAIALVGRDPKRWNVLIQSLPNFTPDHRAAALTSLDETFARVSNETKTLLLEDLRTEVEKHERFPEAKWVLPPDQLASMRRLVDKYTPDDPLEKARIIFDGWSFDGKGDSTAANKKRQTALAEIMALFGPQGIVTLGRSIKNGYEVVEALSAIDIAKSDLEATATLSLTDDPDGLTLSLISFLDGKFGRAVSRDWIVAARTAHAMSEESTAKLLTALPDDQSTWRFAHEMGAEVEAQYWLTKRPHWLKGETDDLLGAIDNYVRFGRGTAALQASFQRFAEVPSTKILEILEAVVRDLNRRVHADTMTTYYIEQAFNALDGRTDVSDEDVARREIMLFPLLEHTQHTMRLFNVMARDPDVYFEVLKAVFRADDEPKSEEEASEHERAAWRINYSILSKFDRLPGANEAGLDADALSRWINRLRDLATNGHRSAITDQYIGRVLAHSPPDADGLWPSGPIREQIESLSSDHVERGIHTERFNMRGVHWSDYYGGGNEERAFAKQYNDYAAAMNAWPRTQALLRSIARNWEADAVRQDEWAEQRKARN